MLASISLTLAVIYSRTIHVPINADLRKGVTIEAGMPWNELVASWTVPYAETGAFRLEVRPSGLERWYTLAVWSRDQALRYSVKGQEDELAKLDTDTLILKSTMTSLDLRVSGERPKTLTLSFANRAVVPPTAQANTSAWGATLDVPQRCQGDYPNGKVICSPTATSMILAYWAQQLGRPVLDEGVERVCSGVFDPNWPGTGNWPFNTAYAGSQPGMHAFVARLWHIGHLEQLVGSGFPVACSVSYDLLKGKGAKGVNDGHLVVIVGFTPDGDPVFNDPGRKEVRQTYKRADFEAAWASSGRTVYVVHPALMSLPNCADQVW